MQKKIKEEEKEREKAEEEEEAEEEEQQQLKAGLESRVNRNEGLQTSVLYKRLSESKQEWHPASLWVSHAPVLSLVA